jgi:hypothetical protein
MANKLKQLRIAIFGLNKEEKYAEQLRKAYYRLFAAFASQYPGRIYVDGRENQYRIMEYAVRVAGLSYHSDRCLTEWVGSEIDAINAAIDHKGLVDHA